jgi:hypothetical protein
MRNFIPATIMLLLAYTADVGAVEGVPTETKAEEAQLCPDPQRPCQKNVRIVLKQRDGSTYDETFPVFQSIVQDDFFTVVPGQTVNVEADIVDGKVVIRRAVDVVTDAEHTFTAKFEQKSDGSMWFQMTNPFDRALKFQLGIMGMDGAVYRTSSCPLAPNGAGAREIWNEPIFQVLIMKGRVAQDHELDVCA